MILVAMNCICAQFGDSAPKWFCVFRILLWASNRDLISVLTFICQFFRMNGLTRWRFLPVLPTFGAT